MKTKMENGKSATRWQSIQVNFQVVVVIGPGSDTNSSSKKIDYDDDMWHKNMLLSL